MADGSITINIVEFGNRQEVELPAGEANVAGVQSRVPAGLEARGSDQVPLSERDQDSPVQSGEEFTVAPKSYKQG